VQALASSQSRPCRSAYNQRLCRYFYWTTVLVPFFAYRSKQPLPFLLLSSTCTSLPTTHGLSKHCAYFSLPPFFLEAIQLICSLTTLFSVFLYCHPSLILFVWALLLPYNNYTNPGPRFPLVLIFPRLPPSQSGVIFSIKYFSPLLATTTPSLNLNLLSAAAGRVGIGTGARFAEEEEEEEEDKEEKVVEEEEPSWMVT